MTVKQTDGSCAEQGDVMGRAGSSRKQCTSQQATQHDMVSSHPLHPVNAMDLGNTSSESQLECQRNSFDACGGARSWQTCSSWQHSGRVIAALVEYPLN